MSAQDKFIPDSKRERNLIKKSTKETKNYEVSQCNILYLQTMIRKKNIPFKLEIFCLFKH